MMKKNDEIAKIIDYQYRIMYIKGTRRWNVFLVCELYQMLQ